jgi:light-regulated signal transduction histidine kinase (bacteriophytochrome)
LEQFAYIASHDLQEPLRSVSSCLQLLKKRYQGQLDLRADELIARAVAGCQRMSVLIDDLLTLSRVHADPAELVETDSAAIFHQVCANLAHSIQECNAVISHEGLPTVKSTPLMLSQLLQNLIGNAIKFRGNRPPVVNVGARRDGDHWVFSVADQGIGIEPEYFDRIFRVFQCLHSRAQYSGSGLGLAICQKIVERHHGRIWVESEPGHGTIFFFTLPVDKSNPNN